jgi:hypothetical protein
MEAHQQRRPTRHTHRPVRKDLEVFQQGPFRLFTRVSSFRIEEVCLRTVDAALEVLAADFALELADAGFLVEFHADRSLMVAKQAGKDRGQGI